MPQTAPNIKNNHIKDSLFFPSKPKFQNENKNQMKKIGLGFTNKGIDK